VFPLTEEEDDVLSNQGSPIEDAKESPQHSEDEEMPDASDEEEQEEQEQREENEDEDDDDDDEEVEEEPKAESVQNESTTPLGSPPSALKHDMSFEAKSVPTLVPQLAVPEKPATQSRQGSASTPAAPRTAAPLNLEDDVLSDSDLLGPWVERYRKPKSEKECDDKADFLLKTRFKPMTDVQDLITILTKISPAQRSTETLYLLAENTQLILQAWQDEFLKLDARVCIHHSSC
jgi:hypothetical protein